MAHTAGALVFLTLPVELLVEILARLDLPSLIIVSSLSRHIRHICSDPVLNPWRAPILRTLRTDGVAYEDALRHLSVLSCVPRHNWIDILSIAHADYLLFEATLPALSESDWELCFKRRFLPHWARWKKDGSRWKAAFLKTLNTVVHRMSTSCSVEEAWTKFIVLNRNGSANLLSSSSRFFNPLLLFNELKIQNNLAHLETRIRVVVEFADARVLALGVLNSPRSSFSINDNAHAFLHPPGTCKDDDTEDAESTSTMHTCASSFWSSTQPSPEYIDYHVLAHPLPMPSHAKYPLFTPGGHNRRWYTSGRIEEEGQHWVGIMAVITQLMNESTRQRRVHHEHDLVNGPGLGTYASFSWADLDAVAPWMEERITKRIDGQGLGN